MRFLLTSDIHMFNYPSYNVSWEGSHPARLLAFEHLGKKINTIATKEKVDDVIIAGDLFHAALLRPCVLNVATRFLSSIKYNKHIIHGQHCIDSKSTTWDSDNSIITLTTNLDDCFYYHDTVVTIGDVKVNFLGWEPTVRNVEDLADADIFVGHHVVSGSKNAFGHVFSTGYDAKQLSDKFKFSVVGDIHMGQTFHGNVLLPGPPIQHSFSDPTTTGVYILDTEDWSCKFVEIKGKKFAKFINVENESEIKPKENVFYKVKSTTITGNKTKSDAPQETDLKALTDSVIDGLKVSNQEEIRTIAHKLIDDSSNVMAQTMPKATIEGIKLNAFGSVENLDLDFKSSKILVLGSVGSGKSTVLKGISWVYYGKTMPTISNDDITPITFKSPEGTSGSSKFRVNGVLFEIVRRLNCPTHGNTLTMFQYDDKGKSSEIKKSSMRETQAFLEELIGLTFDDFCALCYYYQKKSSYFGTMSTSYQNFLLMKFLGGLQAQLDSITEAIKEKIKMYRTKTSELGGSTTTLVAQVYNNQSRLATLQNEKPDEAEAVLAIESLNLNISKEKYLPLMMDTSISTEDCITQFYGLLTYPDGINPENLVDLMKEGMENKNKLSDTIHSLSDKRHTLQNELGTVKNEADTLRLEVKSKTENKCPTCKRKFDKPVSDAEIAELGNLINRLVESIDQLQEDLQKTESFSTSLDEKRTEVSKQCDLYIAYSGMLEKIKTTVGSMKVDNSSEIAHITKQIEEGNTEIAELQSKSSLLINAEEQFTVLQKKVFSNKGVFAKALEGVGNTLSIYINQMLKNADSTIKVTINTVTYNKSGTPSSKLEIITDFGDGKILPYECLSGGQSMLVDCLSIVGFYNVLSETQMLDDGLLGFIALDEIIQYVDDGYVEVVKSVLEELTAKTVVLISHNPQLGKVFPDIIRVSLENGVSVYDTTQLT